MEFSNWITSYLIFLFTFTTSSIFCFFCDCMINKKHLDKKVISSTRLELLNQYRYILPRVCFNTYIITPIFFYYSDMIIVYKPEFIYLDFIIQILQALLLIDLFFYMAHRSMHFSPLYRWSHKIHHRYNKPVGMEALYHHWFDLIYSNLLPIFLSLWVLPSKNVYTWYFWIFMATSTVVLHSHSGWSTTGHNDHHKLNKVHYGIGVFMDKLLGTEIK